MGGSWDQSDNGMVHNGGILGPVGVGDDGMQGAIEREGSECVQHL